MRRLYICLSLMAILCTSWTHKSSSNQQRPTLTVLPVIDHSNETHISWDLSHELTQEIRRRLFDSSQVTLMKEAGDFEIASALNAPNPDKISLEMSERLKDADFVLVCELIDQKQIPYGLKRAADNPFQREIGAVLTLAMRVRVLDLREETPKVILQEILKQDNVISRAYLNCNYQKAAWGTEAFYRTPMGVAHARLTRELVARVEGYIEATRS